MFLHAQNCTEIQVEDLTLLQGHSYGGGPGRARAPPPQILGAPPGAPPQKVMHVHIFNRACVNTLLPTKIMLIKKCILKICFKMFICKWLLPSILKDIALLLCKIAKIF